MLKTKDITSSLITLTIKVMIITLISRGGRQCTIYNQVGYQEEMLCHQFNYHEQV
jgi:hypothetical protein